MSCYLNVKMNNVVWVSNLGPCRQVTESKQIRHQGYFALHHHQGPQKEKLFKEGTEKPKIAHLKIRLIPAW